MPDRFVIDTNILLVSIPRRSKDHWIFEAFLEEKFTLCLSTDIYLEYQEIISDRIGSATMDYLDEIFLRAPNVMWVTRYYKWNAIINDPDDDKFFDVAFACGAKALVTNDRHFNITKQFVFPRVPLMDKATFHAYGLQKGYVV